MNKDTMPSAQKQAVLSHQQQFIQAIFSDDDVVDALDQRGLEIFRRNLQARALQVLSISYPTLLQQIGEELMHYVSYLLLIQHPPSQGDWGEWGEPLPELLDALPALADYPFVAEVARLDWALHMAERAQDQVFDQDSLKLLAEQELDSIYVKMADAVEVFAFDFPVIQLRDMNMADASSLSYTELQNKITSQQLTQYVLVYRVGFKAQAIEISYEAWQLLNALRQGKSLGQGLDELADSDFNFVQWLPDVIGKHIFQTFTERAPR